MPRPKKSLEQKNKEAAQKLVNQKVTGKKGFLPKFIKEFIAETISNSYTNRGKKLTPKISLQKEYDRHANVYNMLMDEGLPGHYFFPETLYRLSEKEIKKGYEYYILRAGKEKKVSADQLAYEMELLASKLSAEFDVVQTKFKPIYKILSKGKYKVVVSTPKAPDPDDFDTDEDFVEYMNRNNVQVVKSDPKKIKVKKQKVKWEAAKKRRQKYIESNKKFHYKKWKQSLKPKQKQSTKKKIAMKKGKRKK